MDARDGDILAEKWTQDDVWIDAVNVRMDELIQGFAGKILTYYKPVRLDGSR